MKATFRKLAILTLVAVMVLSAIACTAKTETAAPANTTTETKPVAETKPAEETKPAAETKPAFPEKEITLIIPYAAGGEGDNIYRCIEESLNEAFGVTVVPEYVGGGNAIPGTQKILDAAPDGYTIGLCAAGALSIQPYMGTATYKTSDFQGIFNLTAGQVVFSIGAKQPYANFQEWAAWVKEHPGEFTVAVGSIGGTPHLGLVKAFTALGLEVTFVPYSGNAEAYAACLGGDVGGYGAIASATVGKEGLNILANFGATPVKGYENLPNLVDLGATAADATDAYWGIVCSKKVDPAIAAVLTEKIEQAAKTEKSQINFTNMKMNQYFLKGVEFETYMAEQSAGYEAIINKLGLAAK